MLIGDDRPSRALYICDWPGGFILYAWFALFATVVALEAVFHGPMEGLAVIGLVLTGGVAVCIGVLVMAGIGAICSRLRGGQWNWRSGREPRWGGFAFGLLLGAGLFMVAVEPQSDYYEMTAARMAGVAMMLVIPIFGPFRLRVRVS